MNPKSIITLFFIGTTLGATIPPTEPSTSHLVQRNDKYERCMATCYQSMAGKYDNDKLPAYCTSLCTRLHGSPW
ncbi:uncharacterized protein LY79DRAFT_553758 [Colletotrichum navitas]|uniref:Uncharacterized protein n=1 Tax=Colletotrichum navitas TaxID=681940 RepID=A0AAD8PZZ5_9PEZI|nr:uncharacterized protein LY79DRAFT_553758 [Colletotrichum navitas]KAK1590694.1 hypothetical protein LY79DRAFT_553758 [Colletotrichum navitas]